MQGGCIFFETVENPANRRCSPVGVTAPEDDDAQDAAAAIFSLRYPLIPLDEIGFR